MISLGKYLLSTISYFGLGNKQDTESFIKEGQMMLIYPSDESNGYRFTWPSFMCDSNGNEISYGPYGPSYNMTLECILTNTVSSNIDLNNTTGGKYGTIEYSGKIQSYNEEDVVIMDIPTLTSKYSGNATFYEMGMMNYNVIVDIPENYEDGQYTKIYGSMFASYIDPETGTEMPMQQEFESIIQINGDILKIEDGNINMYRYGERVITLDPYSSYGAEQDKFFIMRQVHDTTTNKRTYEVIEQKYVNDGQMQVFYW